MALESPLAEFCVFCPSPSSHPTAHRGALHGNPRCFRPTCCRCLAFFLEFTEIWGCSTSLSQASLGNLYTSSQRSPAPELGNQGLLGNWAAGPVFRDRPGCSESWRACRQPREQFLRGKGEASSHNPGLSVFQCAASSDCRSAENVGKLPTLAPLLLSPRFCMGQRLATSCLFSRGPVRISPGWRMVRIVREELRKFDLACPGRGFRLKAPHGQ